MTTIRASTPMFLMSRKIKALGVKMVLSGEGADEVFGGYLYFHKAPSKVWGGMCGGSLGRAGLVRATLKPGVRLGALCNVERTG